MERARILYERQGAYGPHGMTVHVHKRNVVRWTSGNHTSPVAVFHVRRDRISRLASHSARLTDLLTYPPISRLSLPFLGWRGNSHAFAHTDWSNPLDPKSLAESDANHRSLERANRAYLVVCLIL